MYLMRSYKHTLITHVFVHTFRNYSFSVCMYVFIYCMRMGCLLFIQWWFQRFHFQCATVKMIICFVCTCAHASCTHSCFFLLSPSSSSSSSSSSSIAGSFYCLYCLRVSLEKLVIHLFIFSSLLSSSWSYSFRLCTILFLVNFIILPFLCDKIENDLRKNSHDIEWNMHHNL